MHTFLQVDDGPFFLYLLRSLLSPPIVGTFGRTQEVQKAIGKHNWLFSLCLTRSFGRRIDFTLCWHGEEEEREMCLRRCAARHGEAGFTLDLVSYPHRDDNDVVNAVTGSRVKTSRSLLVYSVSVSTAGSPFLLDSVSYSPYRHQAPICWRRVSNADGRSARPSLGRLYDTLHQIGAHILPFSTGSSVRIVRLRPPFLFWRRKGFFLCGFWIVNRLFSYSFFCVGHPAPSWLYNNTTWI